MSSSFEQILTYYLSLFMYHNRQIFKNMIDFYNIILKLKQNSVTINNHTINTN